MIKKFAIALFALASMAFSANAQLYVGGSLGFSNSNSKEVDDGKTELNPSQTTIGFSPEVGFFLSDQFAVGAYINTNFTFSNNRDTENQIKSNTIVWGITPYARWYPIQSDKFGLFLEGQLFFRHEGGKTKVAGVAADAPKTNAFGLQIVPGLSYNLTDNLQLQLRLDVLGANFTHTTITSADGKNKQISNNCGLNFNSRNALRLANVQVGFIYKF